MAGEADRGQMFDQVGQIQSQRGPPIDPTLETVEPSARQPHAPTQELRRLHLFAPKSVKGAEDFGIPKNSWMSPQHPREDGAAGVTGVVHDDIAGPVRRNRRTGPQRIEVFGGKIDPSRQPFVPAHRRVGGQGPLIA
jgi:hypothetical protein